MSQKNQTAPSAHPNNATQNLFAGQVNKVSTWSAIIGTILVGILYAFLPSNLIIGPRWLLLVLEGILLLPLIITLTIKPVFSHTILHRLNLILLALLTLALGTGVSLMVITLPHNQHANTLLSSAALLWCFNILVFALWYWQIDGGGPVNRHLSGHQAVDFMFPQQANNNPGGWAPHFLDYLFLAFTGATALSPADTYPLTQPAKMLMIIEALFSLTIIALLAARAINILGS